MNSQSKSQLVIVLNEDCFSDAFVPKVVERAVVSVAQGDIYWTESDDGITIKMTEIPELCSDQDETDTLVILYCT